MARPYAQPPLRLLLLATALLGGLEPAEAFSPYAAAAGRPLAAVVGAGCLLSGLDGAARLMTAGGGAVGAVTVLAQVAVSAFLMMEGWTAATVSGLAVLCAVSMSGEGVRGGGRKDGFAGKVVWITGASSGIGEAMAMAFYRSGARVILSARRVEELERVKKAPEEMASKAAEANKLLDGAPIDVLVNNGGVSSRALAEDMRWDVDQSIMTVNYIGPVALTKAVLPGMLQQGGGRIVMVSSVQGLIGLPGRTAYSASKHAAHGFFDGLRAEVASRGVSVTLICPGYVKTDLSLNAVTAEGGKHGEMDETTAKGMDPNDLAQRALLAIARRESQVVIAKDASAHVAPYLRALAPSVLEWVMRKRAKKLLVK